MRSGRYIVLKRFFVTICIMFLFVQGCKADAIEVNLARGKRYTFLPAPNYSLCTDENDDTQLTDGKTHGSWWSKKSTVGWLWSSTGIEIVIDLENRISVDKVRVHSVGGGFADVEFPEFIAVLVSDDAQKYEFAGLIGSDELKDVRSVGYNRVPHTFIIDDIGTRARYVKIVIRPEGKHFFLDEIEVIGNRGGVYRRQPDARKFRAGDSERLLKSIEDYLQARANILETMRRLKEQASRLPRDFVKTCRDDLENLLSEVILPADRIFSEDEVASIHKRVGVVRARIYREIYKKVLVCYSTNPMEMVFEKDMPFPDIEPDNKVALRLWRNEYESAAVNIMNCSSKELDLTVSVSPLMGGDGMVSGDAETFTVRRGVFVKALGSGRVADALVLQDETPFRLSPGWMTQIWLTVFNPKLDAGEYHAALGIIASSGKEQIATETIPIDMKIYEHVFPSSVSLYSCVWDQYTWFHPVMKNNLRAVERDLKAHYVNVGLVHPYLIPYLRKPYKYHDAFERYLRGSDFVKTYLLYFEWWPARGKKYSGRDRGRFGEWMSPSWKVGFRSWLRGLVSTLRAKGIGYDRFAVYPFDESLCDEFYQVAKLIKEFDPRIKIYANSFGRGPKDFMRFKDLIDIWSPHWVHCKAHPGWLKTIKGFGKEVWTYGGQAKAPAKTRPPYDYFRLMAWDAYGRGQTGVGFWAYIDRQKHAWDDTLQPAGYYAAVYLSAASPLETHGEKVVPSRRWEAWREGIEDYEYLVRLDRAIEEARLSNPAGADKARRILDAQVRRVVANRSDSGIVYAARQEIGDAILELKGHRQ